MDGKRSVNENVDSEMLKNLDLLLNLDAIEEEESWDIVEEIETHESEEAEVIENVEPDKSADSVQGGSK